MKRLCTICARGGSKGVPGKNLRPLGSKPLICHTVEQALACGLFDTVGVSSDSPAILDAAEHSGAQHLIRRPAELASDHAGKADAIAHCAAAVEERLGERFDVLVDLDATSPLRLPEDIRGAIALLESRGVSNVITGAPARHSPYFNLVERRQGGVVGLAKPPAAAILRRQDSPECFDLNGSVYVWRRDVFMAEPAVFYPDTLLYEMPAERSVDIDSELDFALVELLWRRRSEA